MLPNHGRGFRVNLVISHADFIRRTVDQIFAIGRPDRIAPAGRRTVGESGCSAFYFSLQPNVMLPYSFFESKAANRKLLLIGRYREGWDVTSGAAT